MGRERGGSDRSRLWRISRALSVSTFPISVSVGFAEHSPPGKRHPQSAHGLMSCAAISKRVALAQNLKDGFDQNLDVEPKAPVIDVPEIHFYPPCDLLDRGRCAAQPIDLRPSAHPGFNVMAECIILQ